MSILDLLDARIEKDLVLVSRNSMLSVVTGVESSDDSILKERLRQVGVVYFAHR